MKKILLILMLVVQIQVFGQTPYGLDYKTFPTAFDWIKDTVYINPSFGNGGDGTSPASPFNELADFTFTSNMAYLFERGDSIDMPNTNLPDNIYIGSYGAGVKFKFRGTSAVRTFNVDGDSNIFHNIIIDNSAAGDTGVCIRIYEAAHTGSHWIDSVECLNATRGIQGGYCSSLFITNCYVHRIRIDGIYLDPADTIVVYNSYVHDVNRWYDVIGDIGTSGGDCIQYEGILTTNHCELVIDSNRLDHSDLAGKFAFIGNATDTVTVINNTLTGWDTSSTVFRGSTNRGWTIARNNFNGGSNGVEVGGGGPLHIFSNIFQNITYQAVQKGIGQIFNNTFVDCYEAISINNDVDIYNNIFYNCTGAIGNYDYLKLKAYNNLYYNCISGTSYGFETKTLNPLFTNYASGDYSLQNGSPAINAGKPTGVKLDFNGNNSPYNNYYDIGAFEYGATTTSSRTTISERTFNDSINININGKDIPKTSFINADCELSTFIRGDSVNIEFSEGLVAGSGSGGSEYTSSEYDTIGYSYIFQNQYSSSIIDLDIENLTDTAYKLVLYIRGGTNNGYYSVYEVEGVKDSIIAYLNDTPVEITDINPGDSILNIKFYKNYANANTNYLTGITLVDLDTTGITHCDSVSIDISSIVTYDSVIDGISQNVGAIDITVAGGTLPYSYNWNNNTYITEDLSDIEYGSYNIVVTDDSLCTSSKNIGVPYYNIITNGDTVIVDSIMINFTDPYFNKSDWINFDYTAGGPVNLDVGGIETVDAAGAYSATNAGTCVGNGIYPDTVLEYTWYESANGFNVILTLDNTYLYDIKAYACRADYPSYEMYTQYKIGNDSIELYIENNTDTAHFKNKITDINSQITMNVNSGPSATGGSGRLTFLKVIRKEIVASDNRILFNLNNNTYKDSYFGKNLIINLNQ